MMMEIVGNDPRDWGVPHDKWRPGQFDSVRWVANEVKRTALLQCSTGSGKSAIATAIGAKRPVLSVCSTKNLQDQYGDIYNWHVMKGKNN